MEVIQISNAKFKISLTENELREFDIDLDDIGAGAGDVRRRFRGVIERAANLCGTPIEFGRIFIQIFPSRAGGCELFVTKLDDLPRERTEHDDSTEVLYTFHSLGALIAACRILASRGFGAESVAYRADDGSCALLLPEFSPDEPLPLAAACLDEFGVRRTGEAARIYISEHTHSILSDNAAQRLSQF